MDKNNKKKQSANQNRTPMDAALSYLSYRARSVREMERHLDECNYGESEIQQVIDRLLELNYLDDQAFAENFIRSRLASKPVSRRHLKEQLLSHELPQTIIEEALKTIDDETEYRNALVVGKKFFSQFSELENDIRIQRTMRRLLTRGYSYSCAYSVINVLRTQTESAEE